MLAIQRVKMYEMTRRRVKFCSFCDETKYCKMCGNKSERKSKLHSTSYHQMKDVSCYASGTSNDMVADLGCPNSVIGRKDEENFIENLSDYQRENLEIVEVDENFKFGPSGPFPCREKLRFPIYVDEELKMVDVAIVDAEIPMLLGNNIFKPLEAE